MLKSKTVLLLIVATLLVFGGIAYVESAIRPRERALQVEGMVCEGCAEHLQEQLSQIAGVRSAEVSQEQSQAIVVVDGWSPPSNELLVEAVRKAGYTGRVRE